MARDPKVKEKLQGAGFNIKHQAAIKRPLTALAKAGSACSGSRDWQNGSHDLSGRIFLY